MRLRLFATICLFLVFAFLLFQQEPLITETTQAGIHYRIAISDNQTLFYFQCPEIEWDFEGANWLGLNNEPIAFHGQEIRCDKTLNFRASAADGQIISLDFQRTVIIKDTWITVLLGVFIFLLIGLHKTDFQWDRLAVFSLLWGFNYVMHLISYSVSRTSFASGSIATFFTICAAIFLLCFPKRIFPLVLLAVCQLVEYYVMSPFGSNHTFIITVVNLVLLISLAISVFEQKTIHINRETYYRRFAPILRGIIIILYFWAFFHKLNYSFIDPAVSCAVFFYNEIHTFYPIFPTGDWVNFFVVHSTLIIEGGLALLFLFPKTRFIAMFIGIPFHAVLGLTNFRDFSSMMFVLYFSYVSEAGFEKAKVLFPHAFSYIPLWLKQLLCALIFTVFFSSLAGIREAQFVIRPGAIANVFYAIVFGIVVMFWLYRQWVKRDKDLLDPLFRPASPMVWIVLTLLFINGTMPYVGLKTNNSFDMYSNLQVEAGSNHFFFPAYGQIFGYPNDLVELVDSSSPELRPKSSNDPYLVFWDFRERVYTLEPDYVVFIRDGQRVQVNKGEYENILGERPPLLLRKFMIFEPVNRPDKPMCSL